MQRVAAALALARIAPQERDRIIPILSALTNFAVPDPPEDITRHTLKTKPPFKTDPRITVPAKIALWTLGVDKKPPLAQIMAQDPFTAIPELGDIGAPAKSALPLLESILNSESDLAIRRMAAIAIRKIDPQEAAKLHVPGFLALP
jgi:HEAT repeat protein